MHFLKKGQQIRVDFGWFCSYVLLDNLPLRSCLWLFVTECTHFKSVLRFLDVKKKRYPRIHNWVGSCWNSANLPDWREIADCRQRSNNVNNVYLNFLLAFSSDRFHRYGWAQSIYSVYISRLGFWGQIKKLQLRGNCHIVFGHFVVLLTKISEF